MSISDFRHGVRYYRGESVILLPTIIYLRSLCNDRIITIAARLSIAVFSAFGCNLFKINIPVIKLMDCKGYGITSAPSVSSSSF